MVLQLCDWFTKKRLLIFRLFFHFKTLLWIICSSVCRIKLQTAALLGSLPMMKSYYKRFWTFWKWTFYQLLIPQYYRHSNAKHRIAKRRSCRFWKQLSIIFHFPCTWVSLFAVINPGHSYLPFAKRFLYTWARGCLIATTSFLRWNSINYGEPQRLMFFKLSCLKTNSPFATGITQNMIQQIFWPQMFCS